MKTKFTVPGNLALIATEIACAVIESIPPGWAAIKGGLEAPQSLLNSGEALDSTKFVFASSISQMIEKTDQNQTADIFGTLMQGKRPATIEFGESFGYCEVMPFDQARHMVIEFIRLGYRGRISFEWRKREYIGDSPNLQCEMWWTGGREVLPRFKIEANRTFDPMISPEATVEPIISICKELNLVEEPIQ